MKRSGFQRLSLVHTVTTEMGTPPLVRLSAVVRIKKTALYGLVAGGMSLAASNVAACTMCVAGPNGDGVNATRAAIFNSGFFGTLGVTLLPFVVLAAVVAAMRFVFPDPSGQMEGGISSEGPDAGHGSQSGTNHLGGARA